MHLQTFALTRVLARPPVTPPYLLLGFFVTCVAAACYDLVLGVLREGEGLRYAALGLGALQLCVLGGLSWTAGTYPLGRQYLTWLSVEYTNTPASSQAPDFIRIVS